MRATSIATSATANCCECRKSWEVNNPLVIAGTPWLPSICAECSARAKAKEEADCRAVRDARLRREWERLCPETYRVLDPAHPNLRMTDLARLNPKLWAAVSAWTPGTKGLLVIGSSGAGKTRAVWAMLHRIHMSGTVIVAMSESEFIVTRESKAWEHKEDAWLERLCSAPILFLDDVGHAAGNPRHLERLHHVVEQRCSWGKPVIVTTQYDGLDLASKAGPQNERVAAATIRRLREFCEVIAAEGPR